MALSSNAIHTLVINTESSSEDICAVQFVVGVPPTGIYDDLTISAVENFQIRNKLSVDGQVLDTTFAKLFPEIPVPQPTNILMKPNVTVSGDLSDDTTIKLCQVLLGNLPTGYLDTDTKTSLEAKGYDLTDPDSITRLQENLNLGILDGEGQTTP